MGRVVVRFFYLQNLNSICISARLLRDYTILVIYKALLTLKAPLNYSSSWYHRTVEEEGAGCVWISVFNYPEPQIINAMHFTAYPNYYQRNATNWVRKVNIVQFRVRITGVLARLTASGLKRRNCVPSLGAFAYTTLTTSYGLLPHGVSFARRYYIPVVAWDSDWRVDCFKWPIGTVHYQSGIIKLIGHFVFKDAKSRIYII